MLESGLRTAGEVHLSGIARGKLRSLISLALMVTGMGAWVGARHNRRISENGRPVRRASRTRRGSIEPATIPSDKPCQRITDFRQREPLETFPAREKTEVRILYDIHRVYFGVHRCDQSPADIVAMQLCRGLSMDLDDNFAIMSDRTLRHRNGNILLFL